ALMRGEIAGQTDAELSALQHEIAYNLLRTDAQVALADKVRSANQIAGRRLRAAHAPSAVPVIPASNDPATLFAQFAAFHAGDLEQGRANPSAAADADQRVDFHQLLTALGGYPDLLRRLGLVIDVEIEIDPEIEAAQIPQSVPGALNT